MALGLAESEFWQKTPRQIHRTFKAQGRRLDREHNDRMTQAWYTAAMPMMRSFPELESLLRHPEKLQQQTWQEQLAVAEMWTAMLGGTIRGKAH